MSLPCFFSTPQLKQCIPADNGTLHLLSVHHPWSGSLQAGNGPGLLASPMRIPHKPQQPRHPTRSAVSLLLPLGAAPGGRFGHLCMPRSIHAPAKGGAATEPGARAAASGLVFPPAGVTDGPVFPPTLVPAQASWLLRNLEACNLALLRGRAGCVGVTQMPTNRRHLVA